MNIWSVLFTNNKAPLVSARVAAADRFRAHAVMSEFFNANNLGTYDFTDPSVVVSNIGRVTSDEGIIVVQVRE